jgi:hypothetical protein
VSFAAKRAKSSTEPLSWLFTKSVHIAFQASRNWRKVTPAYITWREGICIANPYMQHVGSVIFCQPSRLAFKNSFVFALSVGVVESRVYSIQHKVKGRWLERLVQSADEWNNMRVIKQRTCIVDEIWRLRLSLGNSWCIRAMRWRSSSVGGYVVELICSCSRWERNDFWVGASEDESKTLWKPSVTDIPCSCWLWMRSA